MNVVDQLLEHNAGYARAFQEGQLPAAPARKLAILACMDARLDPAKALGLSEGDAHVIRNAGGIVTDDALRSLVVSQRLLGTEEIVLVHHTNCGMEGLPGEELAGELQREAGVRPPFAFGAFADAEEDLRESAARIADCPFLLHRNVRALLFEVESGRMREIDLAPERRAGV